MAVNNHLQFARGNTAKNKNHIGWMGEITVDTDKWTLRIHDGKTKGGHELANTTMNIASATNAVNDGDGNKISSTYAKLSAENKFSNNNTFNKNVTVAGTLKAKTPENKKAEDTQVATTEWVKKSGWVVHTFGDEVIDGSKEFTSEIKGTAMRAKWADLAEKYISDFEYPRGTLVCFGGEQEVTIATEKCNGVVSERPAVLMNQDSDGIPVALVGRVDVLVKGKVAKFDNIVLSDVAGVGVVDNEAPVDLVIGKALRNKTTEETDTVLCVVKFNLL